MDPAPDNPSLSLPHFAAAGIKWALIKDRHYPRRQKPGLPNNMRILSFRPSWAAAMPGVAQWNVSLPRYTFESWYTRSGVITPGDAFVFIARFNGAAAFTFYSSVSVQVARVRIYSAPAASYCALNCTALAFREVVTAPAAHRYHATGADGIYTVATRRLRPGAPSVLIEHSKLEAIGDDGIILKTQMVQLEGPPAPTTAATAGSSSDHGTVGRGDVGTQLTSVNLTGTSWLLDVRPGDRLRFFDPRPGFPNDLGSAAVVSSW